MERVLIGAVANDEPFLRIRVNVDINEEDGPAGGGMMDMSAPNGRLCRAGLRVKHGLRYTVIAVETRRVNKLRKHEVMERVH